jgi:hypothetical protein
MKYIDKCPVCGFNIQQELDTCPKCGLTVEKYFARQLEQERTEAEKEKERIKQVEPEKITEDSNAISGKAKETTNSKLHAAIDLRTKLFIGVIIPCVLFILFHIIFIISIAGDHILGWGAMILFYCSFVYIPVLALCNFLIMIPAWRHISIVKIMGLILPTMAAYAEYWFIYR